jgi:AcrR family transcriptional regulator
MGAEVLSRERIVAAALQIVDAEGVEQLSMRRLAKRLGVDPMAIYRHFSDKAAVIDGMVALVFGEFHVATAAGDDWRDHVRAFAAAYRALAQSHPNLIVYLVTHIELAAPAVFAVGESLATTLQRAGLTPLQVITAYSLLVDYLNGFVLSAGSGRLGKPGEFDAFYDLLDVLPADRYPTMRAIYGAQDEATLQAHATDPLELILAGIATWIEQSDGEGAL